MEIRNDLKLDLINSLDNLRSAFFSLNSVWDEITSSEDEILTDYVNDDLSEGYPFKSSFDELTFEVSSWVEDRVDELEDPNFYRKQEFEETINNIVDNFKKLPMNEQKKAIAALNNINK